MKRSIDVELDTCRVHTNPVLDPLALMSTLVISSAEAEAPLRLLSPWHGTTLMIFAGRAVQVMLMRESVVLQAAFE